MDRRPDIGGLGWGFVGLTSGSYHLLEATLQNPAVLGPGYGAATGGFQFGGGGGTLLFGRLWIGGKGYGVSVDTASTPNGSAKLTGGGGGFELGFAAVNHSEWLVIPYVGLGGIGYSLAVRNLTATPFALSPRDIVAPGETREFSAGYWMSEVGIRVMRLLFWGTGGFAAGAEIGYASALSRDSWRGPGNVNTGLESVDLSAAYVRLLLGGGGFRYAGRDSGAGREE